MQKIITIAAGLRLRERYDYLFCSCLIAVVVFTSIVCCNADAQTPSNVLSKEKLVALRSAGVGDSVLIQQIQKDGISFDMTADTTLELKSAGFSNDVLQALLQASSRVHPLRLDPL